jgi:DNA-binding FadR family transcriptional regulator
MTDQGQPSQTDVVVREIKRMIIDGTLGPGSQLPVEKDLAPQLGVSRGSLREGVRALSIMGVLETRQGAGTFVTNLDASILLAPMGFVVDLQHASRAVHLHSVRRILETEGAGSAAALITDEELERAEQLLAAAERQLGESHIDHSSIMDADIEFHRLIAAASGNPVLAALVEALAGRTVRGRMWRAIVDDHAERETLAEHRAILKALADREPGHARLRMANHLLSVEEFLIERPDASGHIEP